MFHLKMRIKDVHNTTDMTERERERETENKLKDDFGFVFLMAWETSWVI